MLTASKLTMSRYNRLFIILLLIGNLLVIFPSFAQSTNLKQILESAEEYLHKDRKLAKKYIAQGEEILASKANDYLASKLYNIKAHISYLESDLGLAFGAAELAYEYAINSKNRLQEAEAIRKKGMILGNVGQYSEALNLLTQSLNIHYELNSRYRTNNLESIANIYNQLDDLSNYTLFAERMLTEAIKDNNPYWIVVSKHYIATGKFNAKKLEEAKRLVNEAFVNAKEINYPYIENIYRLLAKIEIESGNYSEALDYLTLGTAADAENGYTRTNATHLKLKAKIFWDTDKKSEAVKLLEQAKDIEMERGNKPYLVSTLGQLAEYLEGLNDLQGALKYLKQKEQLDNEIFSNRETQQLAFNKVRLNLDSKNQQIKQLQVEKAQQEQLDQLQFIVMLLSGACGILLIYLYIRALLSRKKLHEYADELKQATEAKSSFLARMSHEIRTPINAILGLTKLTQRTALDEPQRENLSQILDSSHTLLGVINDILDFSKIEAGKLTLESVPFSLDQIVKQSLKLNSLKSQEKSLELVQYIVPDVPIELIGDPLRIQQVLNNLLSNAIKFTDKGIVSLQINKRFHHLGLKLEFTIRDSGIGISQQQQERLFQSFNQADESVSRKFGGTGLGLSICKQLVEMMGGDIWVESKLGEGSSFHFTIQIEENAESTVEPISFEQLAKLRVLVVDDIELSRRSLAEALISADINPDLAADGQQAIDKIRLSYADNRPYNLIIIDWQMPELDGLEVVSIINQEFSHQQQKILMISAYDMDKVKELGRPLGISHYLEKPINGSDLINYLMSIESNQSKDRSTDDNDLNIPNLERCQLLLVEDNELNRKVAKGFLKDTGANITVAENGFIALDTLQRYPTFDLILMDIQMPEMDGLTATTKIRNELELDTPIIAMTAQAMAGDKEKCLAVGMNDYVTKPINPEKLYAALEQYADAISERKKEIIRETPLLTNNQPPWLLAVSGIDDIDLDTSLAAFKGNTELYRGLISDFVSAYHSIETDVQKFKEGNDQDAIYRTIHSLKSSSSYIGAISLAHAATNIEQQLKEQLECEEELLQLVSATKKLTGKLQRAIDAEEELVKQESPCHDAEHILDLIEQLSTMLHEADAASEGLAEEIYLCFKETPQQALAKRIYTDTRDFEFDSAQAGLNRLIEANK